MIPFQRESYRWCSATSFQQLVPNTFINSDYTWKNKRYIPVGTKKCWPFLFLFRTRSDCLTLMFYSTFYIVGTWFVSQYDVIFKGFGEGALQETSLNNLFNLFLSQIQQNIVSEILKVFPAFHSDKYFKENTWSFLYCKEFSLFRTWTSPLLRRAVFLKIVKLRATLREVSR